MNKKEFETLLNKLLTQELERLRKLFRPYMRRPFLRNKVIIKCKKYDSKATLGDYENTRKGENLKFTHIIGISDNLRELYKEYSRFNLKRKFKEYVKDVIVHELIHAFTYEEFEMFEEIKNSHYDYSPIFLSLLYWCGGNSGHAYTEEFLKTELWNDVSKCKTYTEVIITLVKYYTEIDKAVFKYNKKNSNKNIYKIDFGYAPGTHKMASIKSKTVTCSEEGLKIKNTECMALNIGFLVDPSSLSEIIDKNFNNNKDATYYKEIVIYKTKSGHQRDIVVRGNF